MGLSRLKWKTIVNKRLSVKPWGCWIFIGAVCLGLTGCATGPDVDKQTKTAKLYWPKPPDIPRYMWESVLHGARDIEINTKRERSILDPVLTDNDKIVFVKPVRVAARGGRIFVTDTMAQLVHVFDAPRRRYFQIGTRLEGTLEKPLGIALDHNGMVYVADSKRKNIVVYDQLGLWIKSIGDAKILTNPVGVGVSPGGDRIYVVNNGGSSSSAHYMVIFDGEGKQIGPPIGRLGLEDGEFNRPTDVCVGLDGRVYVLDTGNFRVQLFDRDGQFLSKWGQVGQGLGQFARPRSIAVDKDNHIYVLDGLFTNLQVFNENGQLLIPISEKPGEDGPGVFVSPSGVAADETGRVYIVDQFLKKVEILRKLSEDEGKKILDKSGQNPPTVSTKDK